MNDFDNNKENLNGIDENEYAYKTVMTDGKAKMRTWSVISFALSVLSVLLCFVSWVGLAFGLAAIALALVSRKSLGYFEKWSVAGLVISIFGIVFSAAFLIVEKLGIL